MTDQRTLFDGSDLLTARARKSDPITSHLAAEQIEESGDAESHRRILLAAVRQWPGKTCGELAHLVLMRREPCGKRLPELRRAGLVRNGPERICSEQGTRQMTWEPV